MKVNRNSFLAALESVAPGLAKNVAISRIEGSDCFEFYKDRIITYNDVVAGRTKYKFPEPIEGEVKGEELLEMLRGMEDETIDVSIKKGHFVIRRQNDDSKLVKETGIVTESEATLHSQSVDKPGEWKLLDENFVEYVESVQQVCGRDQNEFKQTCVHITPNYIEACDSTQSARIRINTGLETSVLVQQKAIHDIMVLGVVRFAESPNWIHFQSSTGSILSCRHYADEKEYYQLDDDFKVKGSPVVLPKGLLEVVKAAQTFSKKNVDENRFFIHLRKGSSLVRGDGPRGYHFEEREINYTGPELKFFIYPNVLEKLVEEFAECIVNPSRLYSKKSNYEYISLLMPPETRLEELDE